MTNKLLITQEEFDQKVEEISNFEESYVDFTFPGDDNKDLIRNRVNQKVIELKEKYEIK